MFVFAVKEMDKAIALVLSPAIPDVSEKDFYKRFLSKFVKENGGIMLISDDIFFYQQQVFRLHVATGFNLERHAHLCPVPAAMCRRDETPATTKK